MANLKSTEQLKLEKLFGMESGYVLDFTNTKFQQFICNITGLDIYATEYASYGDSKAKRLRAFWEQESNQIVGQVIAEMIEYWQTMQMLSNSGITKPQEILCKACQIIANNLLGKEHFCNDSLLEKNESDFLQRDYGKISLNVLNLESGLIAVLNQRIDEIRKNLKGGASLSVIFLCGSVLEGILLGTATQHPQEFNQAPASPKDNSTGKVLEFHKWSLQSMITVAYQIGLLGLDVKNFSQALRDFRNYIHPYEQWRSGFNPDEHTALICWQVLQAAIHDLSRKKNL